MTRYLVQRLFSALITIWVTTVIVTMLIHAVPGDPVRIMYAQWQASPEQIEAVRQNLGLDKPVYTQYWMFLERVSKATSAAPYRAINRSPAFSPRDFLPPCCWPPRAC